MQLLKNLRGLFDLQINTGSVDPRISDLFIEHPSFRLSRSDDVFCKELVKTYFDYHNNKYVNCYRFSDGEDQFVYIDRKFSGHSRTNQSNALFLTGVPIVDEFEFTDDGSNLFCPETRKVARHKNLDIYFVKKEIYQQCELYFRDFIDHYDKFNHSCGPMSFFSFPQLKILGYNINADLFKKDELNNILKVLQDLKYAFPRQI